MFSTKYDFLKPLLKNFSVPLIFVGLVLILTITPSLRAEETTGLTVIGYGHVMVKPTYTKIQFQFTGTEQSYAEKSSQMEKALKSLGNLKMLGWTRAIGNFDGSNKPASEIVATGILSNIEVTKLPEVGKSMQNLGATITSATFSASSNDLNEAGLKAKRLAAQDAMEQARFWKQSLVGEAITLKLVAIIPGAVSGGFTYRTEEAETGEVINEQSFKPLTQHLVPPKEMTVVATVTIRYKIE